MYPAIESFIEACEREMYVLKVPANGLYSSAAPYALILRDGSGAHAVISTNLSIALFDKGHVQIESTGGNITTYSLDGEKSLVVKSGLTEFDDASDLLLISGRGKKLLEKIAREVFGFE